MKKIKLTTFLNILLSILVIASIIYCYFNYKNAELRYGIKGINENEGKIKTKIEYEEVPTIHYNYYDENNYYFEVMKDNKYGFIDGTGNQIIECEHTYISRFNKYGLAEVGWYGKNGFINSNGKQIVRNQYDYIFNFNENGYAKVIKDGKYGFINTKGEEIIECEYDYIDIEEDRYVKISKNEKYGLIDIKSGNIILDCKYDQILQCFEGEFLIEKDDTYYYYKPNKKHAEKMSDEWKNELDNKFVILKSDEEENYIAVYLRKNGYNEGMNSEKFDKNGRVWIEINEKYYYINKSGDVLLEYYYAYSVDDEYTGVADENGKIGLINNETLDLIIECKYNFINSFISISGDVGKYIAIGDENNYIIDKQGNIIKKCNYNTVLENPYNPQYYVTGIDGDKMGIIDKEFNEILECKYDKACVCDDIIICVEENGRKTIFDLNLNIVKSLDEYDDVYYGGEKYIIVKKDNKYGVMDLKGNEILECKYYYIFLEENLVVVGRKEINITFIIAAILGSIFAIALVINNISSKRRKDF